VCDSINKVIEILCRKLAALRHATARLEGHAIVFRCTTHHDDLMLRIRDVLQTQIMSFGGRLRCDCRSTVGDNDFLIPGDMNYIATTDKTTSFNHFLGLTEMFYSDFSDPEK
jgi:hypothetical protein